MKTEISTNELLKLINPTKDEITYKDQKVQLNLKELKKYIEDPKKYDVFNITGDFEVDLYKNLALYIINSNNQPNLIYMDLNSSTIFESGKGLFEYIKNVYKNEETSYINLSDSVDNNAFVQINNLIELPENLVIYDAEDMHYATAASTFSNNPDLTKKTRGQVTWQQLNSDMYGDLNYVVGKVEEVFSQRRKSSYENNVSYDKLLENLFEKVNPELINSDRFQCALIDLNNDYLNDLFIERYNKNEPGVYIIDYSRPVFQEKILEQIKNDNFKLLEQIFNSYSEHRTNYHRDESPVISKRLLKTIDFKNFLNQQETIDYLLEQEFNMDHFSKDASNQFTLASAYPFLDKEKQLNHIIVSKCISLACKKSDNGYMRINEEIIKNLEPSLFNEPFVLAPVMHHMDTSKVDRFLNYKEYPILKDKQFLISNCKDMSPWKLGEWVNTFFNKSDIDKEFIKDLVKANTGFLERINQKTDHKLVSFAYDSEITLAALEGGLSVKNIGVNSMIPLLLLDHNEQIELSKLKFLIEQNAIDDFSYQLKIKGEDSINFKEKYHKPEFLFYKKDNWSIKNKDLRKKSLSKLKTEDEVIKILNKVQDNKFSYEFLSDLFYEGLPKHLQKNKEIVYKLLELGKIPYSNLDLTVAYNCDVALACLNKDRKNIKDIPSELFTNAKFALNFAKLMDRNYFNDSDIPAFVTKFFDNQGVKDNYEDHLKEHLFYNDLQADLDKPTVAAKKTKRAKI